MSKRVLVVEDQEDNMQIMNDMLASAGYEVIEAVTGIEGVAMAESHKPDLILMDVMLPGLDGYQATRRIKDNAALRHIPVIAVTSYALDGEEIPARLNWASGPASAKATSISTRVAAPSPSSIRR